jgi:hypothetical protein
VRASPLLRLYEPALPPRLFARLRRAFSSVGRERLRTTYQTTFWFDFGRPSCVPELVILSLRHRLPRGSRIAGAEWWLSRMHATNVQVDFHQDRDERLALSGGPEVHPSFSSVLFLNRVRGGALAVTAEPPCEDNPGRSPAGRAWDLAAPRPNRFVLFKGDLTHGVLDAHNDVPTRRLREPARLRQALIVNWWRRPPTGIPSFASRGVYRSMALP